jgi:hypothetical protein
MLALLAPYPYRKKKGKYGGGEKVHREGMLALLAQDWIALHAHV